MNKKSLYHPVAIGPLNIKGNLFLAPLAGYTDKAFREICIEQGAELTYTEMVSAEAVARNNKKTLSLLEKTEGETGPAVQIFLPDDDTAERAMKGILSFQPLLIDINCGCPVPKIVKTGAGSALMKNPDMIRKIVDKVTSLASCPVTVKIRLGWDPDTVNYLEAAAAAVSGGASMITLHARTRSQGYGGKAAWEHIARLKQTVPVPVFGSGDLFSPQAAYNMLDTTGADGVMFARGAMGNPFIFSDTKALLTTGKLPLFHTDREKLETALRHFEKAVRYSGEGTACREMRKHLCCYTKGLPGSSEFRNKIVHSQTVSEYKDIFNHYLKNLEQSQISPEGIETVF